MNYAQLDQDNICVGVSALSGEVPEFNYSEDEAYDPVTDSFVKGPPVFVSRMVPIKALSDAFLGLRYTDDGKWEKVS